MPQTKCLVTSPGIVNLLPVLLGLLVAGTACAQEKYDLLLRGGHVIDPRNKLSTVCDVAIRDGKIAAVAPKIDPATALKAVDVAGLYVTTGLIDLHVYSFT